MRTNWVNYLRKQTVASGPENKWTLQANKMRMTAEFMSWPIFTNKSAQITQTIQDTQAAKSSWKHYKPRLFHIPCTKQH